MIVVSDTGPLIAFAKADRLSILEDLFGQVHIPPVVHRELLAGRRSEAARLDESLGRFIQVVQPSPPPSRVQAEIMRLDPGERQAIALAYELGAPLVIDDRPGTCTGRYWYGWCADSGKGGWPGVGRVSIIG